jgi:hypothetical protein
MEQHGNRRGHQTSARPQIQDGLEGRLKMTQLATWNDIADHALASLDEAMQELELARDWMDSDCSDGYGTVVHANRVEAAHLIGEAQLIIDRAKHALRLSAARVPHGSVKDGCLRRAAPSPVRCAGTSFGDPERMPVALTV